VKILDTCYQEKNQLVEETRRLYVVKGNLS